MNSCRLGMLGRTEILLHPAMALYALYAFLTGNGSFFLIATMSIILHEAAHATVSALLGQMPRNIELTPLGAVMRLEDEQLLSPWKRLIMLLAGPGMTLGLCFLGVGLTKCSVLSVAHGRLLFISNLSILLLNILPVLPLDGGRILSLLLSLWIPLHRVYPLMRGLGTISGLGLIALNVYASWRLGGWNLSLAFAGCCILYSSAIATTTRAMAELRQFMDRKIWLERKGSIPCRVYIVQHAQPLRKVIKWLPPQSYALFFVVKPGNMKPCGWLTEYEAIQHYLDRPDASMEDALSRCNTWHKSDEFGTI